MTSSIAGTPSVTSNSLLRRPALRPLADVLPDLGTPPVALAAVLPAPPQPDPHARAMADRVLRAAVEIVGGRRPPHQLASVLRPVLLDYVIGLRRAGIPHLRPRVRSVHSQQPVPGALEATAVVVLHTGVRALCARFEQVTATRWRCTVLHLTLTRGDLTIHRGQR